MIYTISISKVKLGKLYGNMVKNNKYLARVSHQHSLLSSQIDASIEMIHLKNNFLRKRTTKHIIITIPECTCLVELTKSKTWITKCIYCMCRKGKRGRYLCGNR